MKGITIAQLLHSKMLSEGLKDKDAQEWHKYTYKIDRLVRQLRIDINLSFYANNNNSRITASYWSEKIGHYIVMADSMTGSFNNLAQLSDEIVKLAEDATILDKKLTAIE